ncbi:hypothetical protein F5X98DRAFT_43465 [Xylaria grammica]|nr:hypothetical protein F5X98DRAFT_43465 [Xylaria grammica]
MPHYSGRHRSRPSRTNVRESHPSRRRVGERGNGSSATGNEPRFGQDVPEYSQQGWQSSSWAGNATTTLSGNLPSPGPARLEPEWPIPRTMDNNGAFSSNPYYSNSALGQPGWGASPVAYQTDAVGTVQDPLSPATSSPADQASTSINGTYGQAGSTPWSGYHSDQGWSASVPPHWTSEADVPQEQAMRRLSMRARQGSDVGFHGVNSYDNDMPMSMDRPGEHDSGDSSGETTPVDRNQYVDACMSGDIPWSPEFPYQTHG